MANVDIRLGYKNGAWFATNASLVLKAGQYVALLGTGLYKLGDGVTSLSSLPFLGNMTTIPNGLQSGGAITVVTDDIKVAAASWLISPNIYATTVGTDFLNIALSSAGKQRYIGFYGNTLNSIIKVEGAEAAIASYPTTPANTIVIGYVLVSNASISVLPDLSGYEGKVNKTDTVIGNETSSIKYPSIKAVYDWVTGLFVKKGTITNNKILKGSGTDTATDSQISDDGSTVLIKGAFVADASNSSVKIFKITDVNDLSLLEFNINGGLKVGIAAGNGATCADMVAIGYHAAANLGTTPTIGFGSVFLGAHAGEFSVAPSNSISIGEFAGKYSNADNNINIGVSAGAGTSLYSGANNVFISASAGEKITTGGSNIGIGYLALGKLTSSSFNIALGVGAGGYVNTYTGSQNISIGHNAGAEYSTATGNILIGHTTGTKVSTGNNNVFIGEGTGTFTGLDTSGDNNLCIGQYTGYSLNSGNDNTLLGVHVGQYITTGSNNIFLGNNVSNGANKISTGNGNILIGYNLDTTTANPSNTLMIGNLIVGKFDAIPSNQELSLPAVIELPLLTSSSPIALDSNKKVSNLTDSIWGTWINGLTSKTTPVDADYAVIMDSADTNKSKKLSWANIKATLKTYFDTLYLSLSGGTLTGALNEAKSTNIASAATTDLSTSIGNYVHITGTTTITSFGTLQAGAERILVFDDVLTLTHNGTSLILPNASNITTKAGDSAIFRSEGSGNWKCIAYQDSTPTGTWVPSFTGFSSNPTDYTASYGVSGNLVTVNYDWLATSGTSNANTFTMTLPFVSKYRQAAIPVIIQNSGGSPTTGRMYLQAGSNIATFYASPAGVGFAASGQKGVWFTVTYVKG